MTDEPAEHEPKPGLIITLKTNEAVWIGPDVRVFAEEFPRSKAVSLRIMAPRQVKIWRGEEPPTPREEHGKPPHLSPAAWPARTKPTGNLVGKNVK